MATTEHKRISSIQKRKMCEFLLRHPELKKPSNHSLGQKMWRQLAFQCNSLPGSRKSWKRWRKTFQDSYFKVKSQKAKKTGVPLSKVTLSIEEYVASLKFKRNSVAPQKLPEFVKIDQNIKVENFKVEDDDGSNSNSSDSGSHSDSEPDANESHRVTKTRTKEKQIKDSFSSGNLLAMCEKRKLDIEEDYYSIKKNFLTEKLKLMKERTHALKTIASALNNMH